MNEHEPQVTTAVGWLWAFTPEPVRVTFWLVGPKLMTLANALGTVAAREKARTAEVAINLIFVWTYAPFEKGDDERLRKHFCDLPLAPLTKSIRQIGRPTFLAMHVQALDTILTSLDC